MKTINYLKQKGRFYIRRVRRRFEIIKIKIMIKKEKNPIRRAMLVSQLIMIIQLPIPKYNYDGFIIPSSIQNDA